jgi:hypothetical protein
MDRGNIQHGIGADLNDGQGQYPTRTILKGVAFGILE